MEVSRIGEAAGAVWTFLYESDEGATVSALKKIPGFKGDEVVAGIGWLAREGKIEFQQQGKRLCVCLVAQEAFV